MEFLVLEDDGARFGIPARDVREVVRAATLGAPPRRYPRMLGMLNYRGQILGVLELACLRQRTPRQLSPQDHFIIMYGDDRLFGLRVEKAVEIMTWDEPTRAVDSSSPADPPVEAPLSTADEAEAASVIGMAVRPIAHPRLGLVYLLDSAELWSELYVEAQQPTQEVEAS